LSRWIGFSFSQDFLSGHFKKFKNFSAPALENRSAGGELVPAPAADTAATTT
jgi:hypothetical protein